ncbi:MAG: hypothetical protein MUC93_09265 [Bacteroidales bacterium]|jgi:hypothetical protein|nr:hypothetical protein [Bacteroidales bacterium]
MNRCNIIILLYFASSIFINAQDISPLSPDSKKETSIYGFVRSGFYCGIDDSKDKLNLPSAYSDFALKLETGDGTRFKGFTDLRFRYGTEFNKSVNRLDLREAYITVNGNTWDISAGQKIIKWGRADFTNPTQKLSPQNLISRSTDHEDMDMGNLLMDARWYPSPVISIEAVAIPYFRSSVLLIDPLDLPSYIKINQIESLVTDKNMFTYGLKADLHVKGIDLSLSWFDGYDPMPGIALTNFSIDTIGYIPFPSAALSAKPYKIKNIGFDFETILGSFGLRGEAAWTIPYLSCKTNDYVPCREIKWVAGVDWMKGNWRITGEYSGKAIPDFEPSAVEPLIGTEIDPSMLATLLSIPGFDLEEYIRQQVSTFNRLYNYQLEKSYHSAGLRVETDLFHGNLTPSVTTLYNFTSRDLMVMPELIWKPADAFTITAGGEFFSGRKGSVYDIVDEFMNCFKLGLKVNF